MASRKWPPYLHFCNTRKKFSRPGHVLTWSCFWDQSGTLRLSNSVGSERYWITMTGGHPFKNELHLMLLDFRDINLSNCSSKLQTEKNQSKIIRKVSEKLIEFFEKWKRIFCPLRKYSKEWFGYFLIRKINK